MVLKEICLKIQFWPFLSYLAHIKGLCPTDSMGHITTFPTTTTESSTLPPTTPTNTYSSDQITTITPMTTTLTSCPALPLVCLAGGESPVADCPCIDPRRLDDQQMSAPLIFSSLTEKHANSYRRGSRKSHACVNTKLGARAGVCLPFGKCMNWLDHRTDFKSTPDSDKNPIFDLKESVCGFDGENIMVCCPSESENVQKLEFSPSVKLKIFDEQPDKEVLCFASFHKKNTSDLNTAANNPFNPFEIRLPSAVSSKEISTSGCGVLKGKIDRVVGGMEAEKGAYPWMAALGFRFELNGPIRFLCAGALISRRHVLTAAHCIQPGLVLVRLGAHNLSDPLESNAVNIPIKHISVHEMFSRENLQNDIAVMELGFIAPESKYIDVICLPKSRKFLTETFVGMHPFLAGWGTTAYRSLSEPILRVVQVPIVERAVCENTYRNLSRTMKIDDKFICAGSPIADACQGDSGGPLMMPQWDGYSYRFYLFAIVSYGRECSRAEFPGVYTRVASYLPWIRNLIK